MKQVKDIPLGLIGLAAALGFSAVFAIMSPGAAQSMRSALGPIAGCNIKGNVSINSGERIYHMPGQHRYDETIISPRYGERFFCSEAEAREAGWRPAGF